MNLTPSSNPTFPTGRSAAMLIVTGLLGAAVAAVVLLALGDAGQLTLALSTAGLCLAAAFLALEPIRRASRVSLDRVALACLVGIGIRFAATLAGACLLIYGFGFDVRATALWALGWYLLLLVAEVRVIVRFFQSVTVPPRRAIAEGRSC